MIIIRTLTGRMLDLESITADDIDPRDIIIPLQRIVRWNGHTIVSYTVAQHSVRVYQIEGSLGALLHDAAEAYIGDLASPIKYSFPGFVELENRILNAIDERFGCETRTRAIRAADQKALNEEWGSYVTGADPIRHGGETNEDFANLLWSMIQ